MKIVRVETWLVSVELETPYEVAYAKCERTTLAFVQIETDAGLVGYGSAGCDEYVTGETAETVVAAISGIAEPMLRGADPHRLFSILRELRTAFGRQPSALAAVDMARFDILGKSLDAPLWRLLGGFRDRIATSVTLGIPHNDHTFTLAVGRWLKERFTCLKLKGGLNVEDDVKNSHRLRELAGGDVEISFDANQGFTVEEALQYGENTREARIAFLEQPTNAKTPDLLGQVRNAGPLPVMADECLQDAADAFHFAKNDYVDMFNVKLMKCGGIAEALQIEAIARAAGLPIMVGCMDESALGIAAGLHFALARPATTLADLDGHIGLIGDPATPGLRIENGVLFPPDGPGLGIELRRS